MTTWATLRDDEIIPTLDDGTFETTGNSYSRLLVWANRTQQEIASQLTIMDHITDGTINTNTGEYYYALPSDFLKRLPTTAVKVDDTYQTIVSLPELHAADPDHDETSTAADFTYVAIDNTYLYTYPMVAATVTIEGYIKKPTDMTATTSPDLPAYYLVDDLIICGVCWRGFEWLEEKEKTAEYRAKFREYMAEYKRFIDNQYPRAQFVTPAFLPRR